MPQRLTYTSRKAFAEITVRALNQFRYVAHYKIGHDQGNCAENWSRTGVHRTPENAAREALNRVIELNESVISDNGGVVTPPQKKEAQKMIAWAKTQPIFKSCPSV